MIMAGEEDSSRRASWEHYRNDVNSLHPSCSDTPAPMETDEGEVRTVTYRNERAPEQRDRTGRDARRDRDKRRDDRRGDRQREGRDQERERGATRRQRDRGDRAYRARGPHRR